MNNQLFEDVKAALRVQRNLEETRRHCWYSFECDGTLVHVLVQASLQEAEHRGKPLKGKYSAKVHSPHTATGQRHVHVYMRQRELFALNWDGSTRHGKPGTRIANKVAASLSQQFPELRLPPGNILDHLEPVPGWIQHMHG